MNAQTRLSFDGVVSEGVDYITCTRSKEDGYLGVEALADRLLSAERGLGNNLRPWAGLGYEGFQCGQFTVGSRADGYLMRASGECARENWNLLEAYCSNISRLDVQVTFLCRQPVLQCLNSMLKSMLDHKPKHGRKPKVSQVRDWEGGCTIYTGKRQSNAFGRAYSKGAESGLTCYQNCARCEVQFSGHRALGMARYLAQHPLGLIPFRACVCGFFVERGVPRAIFANLGHQLMKPNNSGPRRPLSDRENSLKWLREQVRPTIERLKASGDVEAALAALGLDTQ